MVVATPAPADTPKCGTILTISPFLCTPHAASRSGFAEDEKRARPMEMIVVESLKDVACCMSCSFGFLELQKPGKSSALQQGANRHCLES